MIEPPAPQGSQRRHSRIALDTMQALQGFLSAQQIDCEALLVVNHALREVVLDPIIAVATDVSDSSELFLRSYQLLRIFEPAADRAAASGATGRSNADDEEVLRFEFDLPMHLRPGCWIQKWLG